MNSTAENNKRIAKNTIFLYFRQILIMAVSLYTVRVVLAALGEEDYGIYNVVGGFVSMFSVLSGAFSVGISRFITYEMGQPDVTISRLQRIFSSSILIQMVMGLLICLLISTFGTWFVENKMVIPVDRLNVAFFVLWFSTLSFFTNLLSIPYNALILAHEQMKVFAYIGIVEVLLKLGVACLASFGLEKSKEVFPALCQYNKTFNVEDTLNDLEKWYNQYDGQYTCTFGTIKYYVDNAKPVF